MLGKTIVLLLLLVTPAFAFSEPEPVPVSPTPASEVSLLKVEVIEGRLATLKALHGKLAAESANLEYQFAEQRALLQETLKKAREADKAPADATLDAKAKVWKK